ncbi:MAG: ATP-binding cassette domain-containing protein [Hyphomonadaceae bacterium]|nr:ATP-binding cassette domain-containing protein [Hyphomonadaceae bacterium]
MTDALSINGLVKFYGDKRAVDGVSFSAPQGQITGVLGPNGAGKSTTIRTVVGILTPDQGQVELFGAPISRENLRRIGYLPEERGVYRSMTPRAFITYLARLKGMKASEARARADVLLKAQGLSAYAHKRIKTLSKGMAQKVQLAAAIAHQPDLVVLDEPFSGLDPVNQRGVESLVRDLAASGRTVLFSTHVMEHAERLCDRIVLIANGRKAFEGTVSEALAVVPRTATIETEGAFDLAAALASHGFRTEADGEAHGHRKWRVALDDANASRRLLAACAAVNAPLALYEPARATLHDAFVRIVGDGVIGDME